MAVSFKDFEIEIHKIVKEMKFDTKSSNIVAWSVWVTYQHSYFVLHLPLRGNQLPHHTTMLLRCTDPVSLYMRIHPPCTVRNRSHRQWRPMLLS